MAAYDTCISLLVMAGTMALTACCRRLAHQFTHRERRLYTFILELSGAFQICACTHELRLLADLPPKPQVALGLIYLFTTFHGLSLPGSINNPSSSFQLLCSNKSTVKAWGLQTSAQFLGAALANVYVKSLWALGATPVHSRALGENCSDPIQTTIANAFILELLFSFLFHLALLQFESMNHKTRVHLLGLLIATLVYEGVWGHPQQSRGFPVYHVFKNYYFFPKVPAMIPEWERCKPVDYEMLRNFPLCTWLCLRGHLTGAIFNPALAFSLHLSCFLEQFWNYTLVYWVAPCIGSVLVAIVWDEVIPHIRSHFNV